MPIHSLGGHNDIGSKVPWIPWYNPLEEKLSHNGEAINNNEVSYCQSMSVIQDGCQFDAVCDGQNGNCFINNGYNEMKQQIAENMGKMIPLWAKDQWTQMELWSLCFWMSDFDSGRRSIVWRGRKVILLKTGRSLELGTFWGQAETKTNYNRAQFHIHHEKRDESISDYPVPAMRLHVGKKEHWIRKAMSWLWTAFSYE